jgi:hypothetical protein
MFPEFTEVPISFVDFPIGSKHIIAEFPQIASAKHFKNAA